MSSAHSYSSWECRVRVTPSFQRNPFMGKPSQIFHPNSRKWELLLLNFIKIHFFPPIFGILCGRSLELSGCVRNGQVYNHPHMGISSTFQGEFQLFCFPPKPGYSIPSFPWINTWRRISLSTKNGSCSGSFLLYLWIFIPKFPHSLCLCPGGKIGMHFHGSPWIQTGISELPEHRGDEPVMEPPGKGPCFLLDHRDGFGMGSLWSVPHGREISWICASGWRSHCRNSHFPVGMEAQRRIRGQGMVSKQQGRELDWMGGKNSVPRE